MTDTQPWIVVALFAAQLAMAGVANHLIRRGIRAGLRGGTHSGPATVPALSAAAPPALPPPAAAADENAAIETVLRYVRARLAFDRSASGVERECAIDAVRRAGRDMDAVFGAAGEPGTVWPVPVGAPTPLLEEMERRCEATLRRRGAGVGVVHGPAEEVALRAFRRAFEGEDAPSAVVGAAAAGAADTPDEPPSARLRFGRWLVETGRVSDYR